ncbi:MAG: isoaspartyl peptidase/L-asparaginase family protein [Janthinobacterium lividum]
MTLPARWALVVHGGAGMMRRDTVTLDDDTLVRAALTRALEAGGAILDGGGTALDAVEAAIRILEDDPRFNAGRGAVLTADGACELDAAIMAGADRAAGAVAGVTCTKNPISLARAVMTDTPHVLLGGAGADAFALTTGLDQVPPDYFRVDARVRQYEESKAANGGVAGFDRSMKFGTVGAVACDRAGHVAAGTSTGGVTGKRWGRIGDSPIIGAGTYADDRAAAVSATGSGEYFIREGVAHEICARIRFLGESVAAAADAVVQGDLTTLFGDGGRGGVIAVSPAGDIAWSFNTPGMNRGRTGSDTALRVAIYGDED